MHVGERSSCPPGEQAPKAAHILRQLRENMQQQGREQAPAKQCMHVQSQTKWRRVAFFPATIHAVSPCITRQCAPIALAPTTPASPPPTSIPCFAVPLRSAPLANINNRWAWKHLTASLSEKKLNVKFGTAALPALAW